MFIKDQVYGYLNNLIKAKNSNATIQFHLDDQTNKVIGYLTNPFKGKDYTYCICNIDVVLFPSWVMSDSASRHICRMIDRPLDNYTLSIRISENK